MTIRPFTPHDYPVVTEIMNAVFPDHPQTADDTRREDVDRDPKCRHARFLAENADGVAGYGEYWQSGSSYHPRKFWIQVNVRPEFQRRGIGCALYAHLMAVLEPSEPLSVGAHAWGSHPHGQRFLEQRGFRETMREWESRLDVPAFDPAPWAEAAEKPRAHGIEIRTLRELRSDPEHECRLWSLVNAVIEDIPRPEPEFQPVPFDLWLQRFRDNPCLLPDGYLVAVHNGEYVGLSQLWKLRASDHFETGLTGVRREYRRKGIALALKLRAIEYARRAGCPVIRTWNEVNNRPMLAINEALGFEKQPPWIVYSNVLREEG